VPPNRDSDEIARELQHLSALRDQRVITDPAGLDALETKSPVSAVASPIGCRNAGRAVRCSSVRVET
jgi:hypothetical protein